MENTSTKFTWLNVLQTLWYFMEGFRFKFAFWTITLFVVLFYSLLPPILIGSIVDFFTHYRPGQSLDLFFVYVAVLGVSYGLSSIIRLTAKNKITEMGIEINYNIKVMGFDKLIDFSLAWHDKENTGNKVERIQNGIQACTDLRRFVTQDGFMTAATMIGITIIFIFLSPIFFVFLVMYVAFFSAINYFFYDRLQSLQNSLNKMKERSTGTYFEGLSNILTIKSLGAKHSFKKNIDTAEKNTKEYGYKVVRLDFLKWKIFQSFNGLSILFFLLLVGREYINEAITLGSIFIFYNYMTKLIDATNNSSDYLEKLIEIKSAIGRMMPIFWEPETITRGTKNMPPNWKQIEIRNGSFSYRGPKNSTDKDILFEINNLNLQIKKNAKIGIAGSSGSGKSTLAKLILGMYDLKSGSFSVDKTNYYDISHDSITKHIAIVLQESEMFNLSLEENITMLRKVDTDIFNRSLKIAHLENLIKKLPDGVKTLIGEKGYHLSGGERQRIGIARAICKNPDIFIFDEATSALDNKTESQIQQALNKELKNKTILTIAHRISTIKDSDELWVFDSGSIVETGVYENLINNVSSKLYEISRAEKSNISTRHAA